MSGLWGSEAGQEAFLTKKLKSGWILFKKKKKTSIHQNYMEKCVVV